MGCGVLETSEKNVPGTALLTDDDPLASVRAYGEDIDLTKLKYGKGKNAHIVLVPQPSDDPNDPLNWAPLKKWTTFLALLFGTTMSGVAGPLLSAATLVIQADFDLTLAEAGQATAGWQIGGVAISLIFWAPLLAKLGHRLPFVIGGLIMAVGGVVTAVAKTHVQLLAGRALVGIGMAPAECLAGVLVADLFYLHERGLPMALWNLALVNGINISPALSGLVTARHGWRTAAWIFAGFSFASTLVQFLLQPETKYIRKVTHLARVGETTPKEDEKGPVDVNVTSTPEHAHTAPASYLQSLKLYSGVYPTQATFFQIAYRPFLLMLSPITLYCFLPYGLSITFIVLVAVSSSFIFSTPPYNFGPEQSGYIWFAPFVAALIATLIAGKLSDAISKYIARRNHGIYEPEFRLPLLILFTLFSGFGYLGFGMGAQNQVHWSAPVISFGLIGFGATFGLTLGSAYLVDSFGDASSSALTAMTTLKNFISFSASYWAAPWIQTHSLVSVFGTISGIMFAVGVITIPMYIFGKRLRLLTSKFVNFRDDIAIAH